MSQSLHFAVRETEEQLAELLRTEREVRKRERLQFLYWYQTGLARQRCQIAALLNKSLPTITHWMQRYEERGLEGLLEMDYRGGEHRRIIPVEAIQALEARLQTEEGFASYREIQDWLHQEHGIEVAYSTVHGLVKYGLKASPKVVRPVSAQQDPEAVEAFKKTWPNPCGN
jgi:transposase